MTARILIVDDVPPNVRLLQARLVAEYYQVLTARDGFEALRAAADWQPDLILLDVMMPGIDGYECCRRLKQEIDTQHIPVVMVTTLADSGERVRGLEAGADDFLSKPVDFETLLARVRGLLRLKRLLDEWRARSRTALALGLSRPSDPPPSMAGARALIVDDWDAETDIVHRALSLDGLICERATSVCGALALCDSTHFDIALISLALATEDPLLLASRLRADDATQEMPLLLLAGPEHQDRLVRGFDLGANDWLQRPLDENEIRARTRNQLRRKYYQDRLRTDLKVALEMALTDPLTGLYNQRYLMRHLEGLLETRPPMDVAVLMIDIDRFKQVNDAHGHAAGDLALRAVAETLRANTRVFDSLARYGGEEFVLVMPGGSPTEAMGVAERLRQSIERLVFTTRSGARHSLTISIGIGCNEGQILSVEEMLQAADQAMYRAKRTGRNRTVLAETPAS